MSHGPPPTGNLFGFGPFGMGNMDPMADPAQDTTMMSSLLDPPMFTAFDDVPMSIEDADDAAMSQAFTPISVANPQSTIFDASEAAFPLNTGDRTSSKQSGPVGGSTLTDFTKRKNWSARVVEELKDALQILDAHGRVVHVSPSITALTGYSADDITGRFLKDLVHPDDVGIFVAELNESIASGKPMRLFYRLRKKDGTYGIFESVGHAHIAAAKFAPNPDNQSQFCQAVFMMSRPYPTRNASLLDSFLEHKMENERLKRRIGELRREEAEDLGEAQRNWQHNQESRSDMAPSEDTLATNSTATTAFYHPPDASMPPPERPTAAPLNTALTRENLEGVAGSRADSIRDKMARYEGVNHANTIEMLTGLRYLEGERSRGLSTGNGSPTLIKGDAGIAIPMDRDPRTGEKKKKLKVAEEYVCTDCGTLESPEWRKGPSGPKTLCNACGLRWAKKEKKMRDSRAAAAARPAADPSER